ncbi:Papain family cysteine protease [compost metagenome]
MQETKGLGLIQSPVDKRDILMSSILPLFTIPQEFEAKDLTPVRDQGPEGTCVGFACAVGMKEWQEKKEHHTSIELSPRYLYEKSKAVDPFPDNNPRFANGDGISIRTAMDILRGQGVCEERFWSYTACEPGAPQAGADTSAMNYRIKAYAKLDTLETMKRSLIVNGPFVIGVTVYENWGDSEVRNTGEIPMPNGRVMGGHALCVVGYNDNTQLFKFKNSWSERWGDKGFGYLPYEYTRVDSQFEAYSATDLIENVDALINAREKILKQLDEDFKEEAKSDHWDGEMVIKYH